MKLKNNKLLHVFIGTAASVIIMVILYHVIDIEKTREVVLNADIKYIWLALAVFFVNQLLIAFRWLVFISALDLKIAKLPVFCYFFLGLLGNAFMPSAVGGDIIKLGGLYKHCTERTKLVGSIALDRISGYCGIIIIEIIAFSFGFHYIQDPILILPILFIIPGFVVLMGLMFSRRVNKFFLKITERFPKVQDAIKKFHEDICLLKGNYKKGLLGVLMACGGQTLFAYCFFLLAKALHQDVAYIYFLIFVPLICVAASFPSIGGLGARELGGVALFSRIGVAKGISASLTLMTHVFTAVVGLIGGIILVLALFTRRVQHSSSDSEISEPSVGGTAAESH